MKHWVEGEPEAVHTLFNTFTDNDGWVRETLEILGVNVDDYDTERAEWHDAKVDNKDGYSVPYFEEEYTYERGTLIDQLMDEDMFKDKPKKSCEIIEKDDGSNVRSHLFDVFIV